MIINWQTAIYLLQTDFIKDFLEANSTSNDTIVASVTVLEIFDATHIFPIEQWLQEAELTQRQSFLVCSSTQKRSSK